MPYSPALPATGSPNSSAEMRSLLHGLKVSFDAIGAIVAAQVEGVSMLNPGDPATVSVPTIGDTLHFTFAIPRGNDGPPGEPGTGWAGGSRRAPQARLAT